MTVRKATSLMRNQKRNLILILVILIVGAVFQCINPAFLRMSNVANIFSGYAVYGIMAVGMMLVISTGNIDVSAGAQLAVVSMVVSTFAWLRASSSVWSTGRWSPC